jgi:hypothetical protein
MNILRRIVAALLALADLSERAAARSYPVCSSALYFLRPAEAFIGDYIAELIRDPRRFLNRTQAANNPIGDSAIDAICLAQSFRALAAVLAAFLDRIGAFVEAAESPAGCSRLQTLAAILFTMPAGLAAARLDTS